MIKTKKPTSAQLKKFIKDSGKTQADIARELNISRPCVSKTIKGETTSKRITDYILSLKKAV